MSTKNNLDFDLAIRKAKTKAEDLAYYAFAYQKPIETRDIHNAAIYLLIADYLDDYKPIEAEFITNFLASTKYNKTNDALTDYLFNCAHAHVTADLELANDAFLERAIS